MIIPGIESATLNDAEEALTLTALTADTIALQVTGTFTGTITFEASVDGTNYVAIAMKSSAQVSLASLVTTTTAAGVFTLQIPGVPNFRARMSSYTSGDAVVTASLVRSNK